jgi:hypothetical protein
MVRTAEKARRAAVTAGRKTDTVGVALAVGRTSGTP